MDQEIEGGVCINDVDEHQTALVFLYSVLLCLQVGLAVYCRRNYAPLVSESNRKAFSRKFMFLLMFMPFVVLRLVGEGMMIIPESQSMITQCSAMLLTSLAIWCYFSTKLVVINMWLYLSSNALRPNPQVYRAVTVFLSLSFLIALGITTVGRQVTTPNVRVLGDRCNSTTEDVLDLFEEWDHAWSFTILIASLCATLGFLVAGVRVVRVLRRASTFAGETRSLMQQILLSRQARFSTAVAAICVFTFAMRAAFWSLAEAVDLSTSLLCVENEGGIYLGTKTGLVTALMYSRAPALVLIEVVPTAVISGLLFYQLRWDALKLASTRASMNVPLLDLDEEEKSDPKQAPQPLS